MTRKTSADLVWFKSSYSDGPDGNSCVELALTPEAVHVRDSKVVEGPQFTVAPTAWARFLPYVSEG
ncbi:DUF397 domain-containing protein [Streptomyces sp. NPDC002328]|uniref:DUF397 domain-containing protein n=1 Tax=Streptomyces sp. NPDC002328 TaxID=3364642 RepID=UPI0036C3ABBF